MSRINCNVTNDLIPLYVDDVLSSDSRELVDEHLAECGECSEKVEKLRSEMVAAKENSVKPLKKIKGKMKKDKRVIVAVSVGITAMAFFIAAYFLDLIQFDESYFFASKKITVVTAGDMPNKKYGHDAVILYDGPNDYAVYTLEKVVGHKDGVKQVEVTLYVTRFYHSLPGTSIFDEANKYNGNDVIYEVHSFERQYPYGYDGDVSPCDFYDDYDKDANLIYHSIRGVENGGCGEDADGGEIVAIYYGKYKYNEEIDDEEPVKNRKLLWAKEGYKAE